MAISLPALGEEVLIMDDSKKSVELRGEFYQRVLESLENRTQRLELNLLLKRWAQLLFSGPSTENYKNAKLIDQRFIIPFKLKKNQRFSLKAYRLGNFYRRVTLSLESKGERKKNSLQSVKIHLFPKECF